MKIAVISDIHSNLEALESAVDAMPEIDSLWCLGDVVGYGSQPAECISRLQGLPMPLTVTAGNHDLGAAGSLTLETFNPEGRAAIEWTRPRLSDEERRWLQNPSRVEVRPKTPGAGQNWEKRPKAPDARQTNAEARERMCDYVTEPRRRITPQTGFSAASLLHAGPRDPTWEYVTTAEIASECFTYFDADLCFFGHTHRPMIYAKKGDAPVYQFRPAAGVKIFLKELGDRWMVNPGSVGQPRDHDPRASFLVFEPDEMSVIWHRVDYQFEITAAKIREAGLPPVLADRLAYGI